MSYNTDLPPKIVRTNQTSGSSADDWELRTAGGQTIQTYTAVGIGIGDWWQDLLAYVASNASSTDAAVQDITLLLATRAWQVND